MEYFPAADEEQFEYIKSIIDDCDYYIVIAAGKYGSIHPEFGLSYTELEYDYAVSIGKPVIRYLFKDPFENLAGSRIEQDETKLPKLKAFLKKLSSSKMVSFWTSPKDLGLQVAVGLLELTRKKPAVGWVRGDREMSLEMMTELNELREKSRNRPAEEKGGSQKAIKPVSFDELKGTISASLMVQKDDNASPSKLKNIEVEKRDVAETVFLALLEGGTVLGIVGVIERAAWKGLAFPAEVQEFEYHWLTLDYESVRHFLHYLEARGLIYQSQPATSIIGEEWKFTTVGRQCAAQLKSLKTLF